MKYLSNWCLGLNILGSLFVGLFVFNHPSITYASVYLNVEGAGIWQSRNDQRIPGDSGTKFSISDFETGPFLGYRVYAGKIWDNRHELRALFAPFSFEVDGELDSSVLFSGVTFAANTPTTVYYKFNSYRLTYAYHFNPKNSWSLAAGFTAKVRDAEVKLKQGALVQSKSNVGFVPLLNLQAQYDFKQDWFFRLDFDGLIAPQGRAIDVGLFVGRNTKYGQIFGGYRSIEGGADNKSVYNFAWIHQAVLGAKIGF